MATSPAAEATAEVLPVARDPRPIGVFDSGVGGLTVVAALRRRLPEEPILYLGDTARLPYGTKSEDTVTRYSQRNIDFLVDRGVKAVVVACNSASALALGRVRSAVPLRGVLEPGARSAAEHSKGHVGVIATESTVRSDAYRRALVAVRSDLRVSSVACPLFVPLVEEGWVEDEITEAVARRYLEPLLAESIDTLVLGCTHYPLLRGVLARVCGPDISLIDSAEAVAARVTLDLGSPAPPGRGADAELRLCVTDASERFRALAERILGRPLRLEWVDV